MPDAVPRTFTRFVALGDSTTEGVGDPYPDGSERGWADRLAARLAEAEPAARYANLAIRGRLIGRIREEQLDAALALEPDLASVIGGLNDVIRPSFELPTVLAHMEAMQRQLIAAGATVVTITFPDLSAFAPVARLVRERLELFNDGLRGLAERTGAVLVDLGRLPAARDARLWCSDRLHPNPDGHQRITDAVAAALALPGSDDGWRAGLPPAARASLRARAVAEARWAGEFLTPWIGRRLTGRSSGDGRAAKRPEMLPVLGG
ncbi:SGNH/GDSL hydrolase family protein [Patulibacter defluvii]|uniref:SGNH/GDSL hydrolase family protein n=1 Tax=Patulibacter defluvii TaxID=3095358 RepID=UPI002A75580B|nr:SGNH/GDSL hydrolase family protein [Patulibacter sp. DM4]